MKLSEIVRSETNERFLNTFNNAVAFILDINDYTVSICVCVEVLNILRYKINNIRSTLNELMLIITELRNVHERNENRVCLRYWKKMIFLISAILRSLLLLSFSKIIVNQETWTSSAMIQENNNFFMRKSSKIISTWLSKDSSTFLTSSWKKSNKSTWQLLTLMFIKTSRQILLSLQTAHLNHLCWFQTLRHFDRWKNLTSIFACDHRMLNDLNKLFNKFLKN